MTVNSAFSTESRWLSFSGWFLVSLGLFHLVVWCVLGGSWEGPISWRKPILFGVSTGITLLSFGWIYGKIRSRSYDRLIIPLFACSLIVEVVLITIQQWRGVPSHFNSSTPGNAAIDNWMTALITFASLVIVDLSIRCYSSMRGDDDTKLAIRSGVVFLLLSIAIGYAISFYGHHQIAVDQDPGKYGKAGVTKFPHGLAIHAIQLLPASVFLLRKAGSGKKARIMFLRFATASMATLLIFSLWQTLAGYARLQPNVVGLALLTMSGSFAATGLYKALKR